VSRVSLLVSVPLLSAGLALSGGAAQAASCPEPTSAKALVQEVSSGDAAFAELDDTGFSSALARSLEMVPCLSETVTPGQAALFHKLHALGAFVDRDDAGAVAHFRSVVAASPGYKLPESLAPEGHPLRTHFAVAEGTIAVPEPLLPVPKDGTVHVDGRRSTTAPLDRPFLYQRLDGAGQVVESALLTSGQQVPAYDSAGKGGARRGVNVPLAATSGIAAVASGVLFLSARSSAAAFWDPTTPTGDLDTLRSRTNTLGWLSAGAGVVAVGTGAGAFISGTF
jgi:hypothetical protein